MGCFVRSDPRHKSRRLAAASFSAPDRARLLGEIQAIETEFEQLAGSAENRWYKEAGTCLAQARDYYEKRKTQQGWISFKAARRALLRIPEAKDDLEIEALTLREELAKLDGWRKAAISKLLYRACSAKLEPEVSARYIVRAIKIRDESEDTRYFKIMLRRRGLVLLTGILLFTIIVIILSAGLGLWPNTLESASKVIAAGIFGMLGATISVSQSLLRQDMSAKVPEIQVNSVLVWTRPVMGAAVAIIALAIIGTGFLPKIFDAAAPDSGMGIALAVLAGYSERFIIGALSKAVD